MDLYEKTLNALSIRFLQLIEKGEKVVVEGENVYSISDFVVRLFSQFENNGHMLTEAKYTGNYGCAMYSILKNNLCPTVMHSNMAALISYWALSNHINYIKAEIPFVINRGLLLYEYKNSLIEDFKEYAILSNDNLSLTDEKVLSDVEKRFKNLYMNDFYNMKDHIDLFLRLNFQGNFQYYELLKPSVEREHSNFNSYVKDTIIQLSSR